MIGKPFILSCAASCGAFTFCRWLTRHDARILAYHGVDDGFEPLLNFDGFHVRPEIFEKHLRTLRGHYKVVTLPLLVECFRRREPPPSRAVAITFDDGYQNNARLAARLLGEFCMTATFFVTTGFIDGTHRPWWFELRDAIRRTMESRLAIPSGGGEAVLSLVTNAQRAEACVVLERELKSMSAADRETSLRGILDSLHVVPAAAAYQMMTWDEVRKLREQGHEIGAHTVSHISLGHESRECIASEITGSIARICEMTGHAPKLYSYPYGEAAHFTGDIAQIVRDAGCIGGVTAIEGFNRCDADPYLLRRLNVTGNHDRNSFRALVSGLTGALQK